MATKMSRHRRVLARAATTAVLIGLAGACSPGSPPPTIAAPPVSGESTLAPLSNGVQATNVLACVSEGATVSAEMTRHSPDGNDLWVLRVTAVGGSDNLQYHSLEDPSMTVSMTTDPLPGGCYNVLVSIGPDFSQPAPSFSYVIDWY